MGFALVLSANLYASCGPADDAVDESAVTRTVIGDTTIVRSAGPGAWGDSVKLVEELAIGVLEGDPEYQFESIAGLAVDADGGIYVLDSRPILRYYDPSGAFVREIGREGQGPGEYSDISQVVVVRAGDGRVVVRDPGNARLNVFEPDGSLWASWPVDGMIGFDLQALTLGESDQLYVKVLTGESDYVSTASLRFDATGKVVDTIFPPTLPDEPTELGGYFGPRKTWAVSPEGGVFVGVTSRYAIDHYRPDGTVLRIERDVEPVAVHPEEKAELEAFMEWERREFPIDLPREVIPDRKPAYRYFEIGDDGRLWVMRFTAAIEGEPVEMQTVSDSTFPLKWNEPLVYDVFDGDGSFLGSVAPPDDTYPMAFRGDRIWGVRYGEFDEPYVVVLRIVHD